MTSFLSGCCLEFAHALKKTLGKKAHLVDLVEPYGEKFLKFPGRPHHVLVEYENRLYDASGFYTPIELFKIWSARAPYPVKWKLEPHDPERARDAGLKRCTHLRKKAETLAAHIKKEIVN